MLLLAKTKFVSKKLVIVTINFVYISRNSSYKYSKTIAISKDEYFNYYKIDYFDQDCKFFDYCIMKKSNNSSSSNK